MEFKDYLSFEQFKEIYLFNNNKETIDNAWREKYHSLLEKNFELPLLKFLSDKRDNEGLLKIEYSEGHLTRASVLWNNFLENTPDIYNRTVKDIFSKPFEFTMYEGQDNSDESILKTYNKINELFTKGDFRSYLLPDDVGHCQECAQRLQLSIKDWKPSFSVFAKKSDGSLDYKNKVKPEDCLQNAITEVKINFPSGELLVADWIRIPEFNKATKNSKEYSEEFSLNNTIGRVNTTKYYAEEFNFICVSVGNSSPSVFLHNSDLVVGHLPYNKYDEKVKPKKGYQEIADVCTDFWGVTMIDKVTLIDILSKQVGNRAEEIVNKYIENKAEGYSFNLIQVEPGDYTLKFHGNTEEFNDVSSEKKSNIEKDFILTKNPKPVKKLKM